MNSYLEDAYPICSCLNKPTKDNKKVKDFAVMNTIRIVLINELNTNYGTILDPAITKDCTDFISALNGTYLSFPNKLYILEDATLKDRSDIIKETLPNRNLNPSEFDKKIFSYYFF